MDNFLQLAVRHGGTDLEDHPNSLLALANVRIEAEKSVQIKMAFDQLNAKDCKNALASYTTAVFSPYDGM